MVDVCKSGIEYELKLNRNDHNLNNVANSHVLKYKVKVVRGVN